MSCTNLLYIPSIKFFWFFSFKKRTRVPFPQSPYFRFGFSDLTFAQYAAAAASTLLSPKL